MAQKRSAILQVRVTPVQAVYIRAAARRVKVTVSTFIAKAALEKVERSRKAVPSANGGSVDSGRAASQTSSQTAQEPAVNDAAGPSVDLSEIP